MGTRLISVGLALIAGFGLSAQAQDQAQVKSGHAIRIVGRKKATVTQPTVRLGDIAAISSKRTEDEDSIIALGKLHIADAPAPGKEITLSAAAILQRMRDEAVNFSQVGYTLPRLVTVERASRTIRNDEVRAAIEAYLSVSDRDLELRSVAYDDSIHIAPGLTEMEAVPFSTNENGRMGFTMSAAVGSEAPVKFNVTAEVDEWREVPVASRQIAKGATISGNDIRMARLNVNAIPQDSAVDSSSIIGFETNRGLAFGEVFRLEKLEMPPVVSAGSAVTLVYTRGRLEATASGVALENGGLGQEIKVRNAASKKIIVGRVIDSGLVGVGK